MKISQELRDDHQVELTIELDDEQLQDGLRRAARVVSRRTAIPGFRPGRAPYRIVAAMVGRDVLMQEVVQQLGPGVYQQALEETGIEPFSRPELEVVEQKPLTLRTVVPLKPVVELGDYHSVRVVPQEVSVSDEDVDQVLRSLQERAAQWVPVDRPAALGDQVTLDIEVTSGDETLLEAPAETLVLSQGLDGWPPGFAAEITGMSPEESAEFDLAYPSDFPDDDLAGRQVTFSVAVHTVREQEVPDLDDELARTVSEEDTLEALRERIREQLLSQRQATAEQNFTEQVLEAVLAVTTIKFPPLVVDAQIDDMLAAEERQLAKQNISLDQYLNMLQMTREAYRQQLRTAAEDRVRRQLLLGEIVRQEGIEVTDAELDEEIERRARGAGDQADAVRESLNSDESRQFLRSRLLGQRALDRLKTIAQGEAEQNQRKEPNVNV